MADDLQGEGVAEDPHAGQQEGGGENDPRRVPPDPLAGDALCELPAGGAVEHQLEGLAVDTGPLGHNVGDKAAVVIGRELHWAVDGRVDVDPMGPDIPGEPNVE